MKAPPPLQVLELGLVAYEQAHARQLELVGKRQRGDCEDVLLLCEHPHVITKGRSKASDANVLAPGDVPVIEVERGGDVTYHGPGQLVAYPIVLLREGERDLHKYLRNLEAAVIETMAAFGLTGDREAGKTGVWTSDVHGARRKLCSLGIACRRWVCFHGLALNVVTDLTYFSRINPCGFDAAVMTSMSAEQTARGLVAPPATLSAVKEGLAAALAKALVRDLRR
ncbi:MAG: lipoyl(octanoyl) transferase LipB [Myxococcales bacterium]|nr:lipoyl(octanoyl) transferase LipB [Myxococcales bacterium]